MIVQSFFHRKGCLMWGAEMRLGGTEMLTSATPSVKSSCSISQEATNKAARRETRILSFNSPLFS